MWFHLSLLLLCVADASATRTQHSIVDIYFYWNGKIYLWMLLLLAAAMWFWFMSWKCTNTEIQTTYKLIKKPLPHLNATAVDVLTQCPESLKPPHIKISILLIYHIRLDPHKHTSIWFMHMHSTHTTCFPLLFFFFITQFSHVIHETEISFPFTQFAIIYTATAAVDVWLLNFQEELHLPFLSV